MTVPVIADGGPATPSAKAARQTIAQVAADFNTNVETGLQESQIQSLLGLHGPNDFEQKEEESLLVKFYKSFTENPLILLLLASAVVSLLMRQMDDAISITLAIVIVVTVAFVQEYRSEKSLEALNKLVPHYCHLLRDGHLSAVLANQLVPGDIVRFSVGDRIPADIRLLTAVDLEIDESNLTGETNPRRKHCEPITANSFAELALSERDNIGFMGTLVRNGHGSGIVVGTGKDTEFGKVFEMMQEVEDRKTPLQLSMNELGKQLSYLSFGVIGVIVIIGLIQGLPFLEMFTIGVSLAVAAIPEGLPIVVTVTLALGVLRMANRRAIVKQLPSVETLGSVNVICADKTGTLTVNQMTVTKVFTLHDQQIFDYEHTIPTTGSEPLSRTLRIGNLCNNAWVDDHGKYAGQPTDIALLDVVIRSGLVDERPAFPRVSEIAFNSDQKFMSVTCTSSDGSGNLIYLKGAFEPVMERCTTYYVSENHRPSLTSTLKDTINRHIAAMSSHGLRVLCMAYGSREDALCFTGFVAVYDPPRMGVSESIKDLVQGGVKVVMITGDSDGTALSIARKLGIPMNPTRSCLTGQDIERMSERQLQELIGGISVFARTTPRHKLAIVKAFQAKGGVVAMTGDGVNDAPALKMADIGISMGKSGTDVSKEAADMILVDDDFSTILSAVEEGKSIFYNIQNFLTFQLSTSVSALSLIALSTLFGYPTPLNAMQILWINIIMDGPPAQSLGVEPVDHDVMKKPPRSRNAHILTRKLVIRVLTAAVIVVLGTVFIYTSEMADGQVTARDRTMTFTTFVFFDMFNALACRSEKKSIFTLGLFSNQMFNLAVGGSVLGQLCVIYVPFFQAIFQTEAISLWDLVKITILTSSVFWSDEIRKFLARENIVIKKSDRTGLKFQRQYSREIDGPIDTV
ncbi:PMR1-type calcium-transporting P-type ATPase [Umbelopsis sp. PMI_123]|nr:PMR1-type calcium-transporting P-type ATPase [Umbelopsis sp. PMI_123]